MSNTGSCLSSANECALGALFLDCFDMKPGDIINRSGLDPTFVRVPVGSIIITAS